MGKGILKRHEPIEPIESKVKANHYEIVNFYSKSLARFVLQAVKTIPICRVLSVFSVKWDEEKLKASEAIKETLPKGQIDEPKTPFQHGQYGSSKQERVWTDFNGLGCDECAEDAFKLRSGDETEEGSISDSSFRRASFASSTTGGSGGWESSLSEFETDVEADTEESKGTNGEFKSMRAQHYFMKQALQRGKELIETEDEEEYEFNE